jgi:methionyl-tRNA formyltransferase
MDLLLMKPNRLVSNNIIDNMIPNFKVQMFLDQQFAIGWSQDIIVNIRLNTLHSGNQIYKAVPWLGMVNFHNSILPKYMGPNAFGCAIMDGAT